MRASHKYHLFYRFGVSLRWRNALWSTENGADAKLLYLTPTQDPLRFQTIELPKRQPLKFYASPFAPIGAMIIDQVPFYLQPLGDESGKLLGHHAIDLLPTENNAETVEEVFVSVHDVVVIHFLLSAGNGWISMDGIQYMGREPPTDFPCANDFWPSH